MDADPLSLDAVFSILDTRRRRLTLAVLDSHRDQETLALADLADEVAVREHDTRIPNIDPAAVTDIYLSLYHNHVPALVDANLVEYDQDRDLVASTGRLNELEPFLSMTLEAEPLEESVATADRQESGRE